MSTEDNFDTMDSTMDISGYDDEEDSAPLFWSMKLEANKPLEIDPPKIEGYIVHITNACFGATITKQSRTVIMVNPSPEDDDTSLETPICVLRAGQQENQSLDLLFNESATLSLKGQKVSTVYLTGYIQPPVEAEMPLDPMYEDMNEEEIEAALREQRRQQMSLDDDEEEEEPQLIDEQEEEEEDDDIDEPPTKKQKTSKGSKSTKNGTKSEGTKKRKSPQQKSSKSAQQKPVEIALNDDKKEEKPKKMNKKDKKDKKNKKKGMQNMKGGIKYRDMKVGDGKQISNGDKLSVFYVGQLDDKKVFDKAISGKGFEFNFGAGDVIKGWDMGLKGMKVGGKRKLIIPSKLGYGSSGSPPTIPSNANLTFTIEVKAAN